MQRNVNEEQCLPLWGRELEAIEKEYAKRLTPLAVFYVLGARYRSIGCTFIPFCMFNIVECIFYSTYLPEALVKRIPRCVSDPADQNPQRWDSRICLLGNPDTRGLSQEKPIPVEVAYFMLYYTSTL